MGRGVLRAIKKRIKSIESTKKITKAMQMVAAAKLQKIEPIVYKVLNYKQTIIDNVKSVINAQIGEDNRFIAPKSDKKLLIIAAGDRGLCGSFNANILKEAIEKQNKYDIIWTIGAKATKIDSQLAVEELDIKEVHEKSVEIADKLYEQFGIEFGQVDVLYSVYKNKVSHPVVLEKIVPIEGEEVENKAAIIFEPDYNTFIEDVMKVYLRAAIYSILVSTKASEFGARMVAMKNATDNADELNRLLILKFNKERQASITQELLEVTSGAEALQE